MIINWSLVAVALIILVVCALVIAYACCVICGDYDQWAEDNLDERRS